MKITGGCYCKKIRYEAEGEPLMRGLCHCRECQYSSGGAANVALAMPVSGFRYTVGEPKSFERSDLESPVKRQFCGDCGTSLSSLPPGLPDMIILKVGTLDDPTQYGKPDMAFYCIEKQAFHYLPDELPQFDRFPG
ncbi:MAG: GFA family protein [Halioglobus sp.]|nr:GFA family protein [Halioglobus sp.]